MFLNIGNVVALKSNPSNKMTVNKIVDGYNVGCCWMDENGTLKYSEFPNLSLILMVENGSSMGENVLLG